MASLGAFYRTYRDATLGNAPVTIANRGAAAAQVVLSVTGNPIGPEPAAAQGYEVERSYYRLNGTKIQPTQVQQNERLVTVLKVTEPQARYARVLLVDRLPAGFEIDNPKLVDSGSVEALDWLKTEVEPANVEYRDDRFVAAFDRTVEQGAFFTVAYIVRAVTPGTYKLPAVEVEAMYQPESRARAKMGSITIKAY